MVYRTSMQIVADMLYATEQSGQEGIKTTSLLTKANLSHSRLEKFISNLTGAGLMNKIEYDGKNIKKINIDGDVEKANRSEYVRNIIESDDGIIYLSGPRLIGLLEKNQFGSKQYSSLFNKIPDSINKNRQSFINTLKLDNKIYFSTPERIFRWDGEKFDKIWKFTDYQGSLDSKGKLHFMFKVDNRIFVRQWGVGLLELKNEDFNLINGSDIYSNNRIEVMYKSKNNNISILSSTNGFH